MEPIVKSSAGLIDVLKAIHDPRGLRGRRYPAHSILCACVLATLSGVEREIFNQSTEKTSYEVVYGITSLGIDQADPATLLALNRGHWSIENKSHYVRDVVFDEDRCRVRTGNAAQLFASIRNLAIGIFRILGVSCIASGIRQCMWRPGLAMRLIGLDT